MAAIERLYCAYVTCSLGFSASGECQVTDDFLSRIEKSLTSGRRQLSSAAAAPCLEAVATLDGHACWGEQVFSGLARMNAAFDLCEAAAPGTLTEGERCFDDAECVGGWCDLASCPGKCIPFRPSGGPCEAHVECGHASVCLAVGEGAAHCVPLGNRDAQCDEARPCLEPFACVGGVCAEPAGASSGASCLGDADCGSDARCVDGRCLLKSGIGGPCTAGVSLFPSPSPDCRGSLVCAGVRFDDEGRVEQEGRCAVPSELQEPCYPDAVEFVDGVALNTSADGCYFGLVCDPATRRCAAGPGPGEPCLAGRCAQDSYCDGVRCQALRAPGQSCRSPVECFGACEAGVCAEPPPNVACPPP
jgi:hypothetical protein